MARKPGLGKGLGALIPDGGSASSSPDESVAVGGPLRKVPVASIRPNKFQPRKTFDADGLKALSASVREL
jgi:ParB family chromosome partitioning protein